MASVFYWLRLLYSYFWKLCVFMLSFQRPVQKCQSSYYAYAGQNMVQLVHTVSPYFTLEGALLPRYSNSIVQEGSSYQAFFFRSPG